MLGKRLLRTLHCPEREGEDSKGDGRGDRKVERRTNWGRKGAG